MQNTFARFAFALFLFWPAVASAQITGRFYLEKDTFAPGDPVFVYFELKNEGTQTQNVYEADPYSVCSGYEFQMAADLAPSRYCGEDGIAMSCLSSDAPLEPGKTRTERILLNYVHKISAAGEYDVKATRHTSFVSADLDFMTVAKTPLEVTQHLHFRIDENAALDNASIKALVRQLTATDARQRREATLVLATLAPKSQEDLLLGFADNQESREWAPLAFRGLNTPRSLEAMAELVRTANPGSNEFITSAEYLAETGDSKWYPLLLGVYEKNPDNPAYLYYVAESGRDQIIPLLLQMLGNADQDPVRADAISALGYTASRAAVPILLGLLRSPNRTTSEQAFFGLRQLTHREPPDIRSLDNPQSQYPIWSRWWNREGADAHIFKVGECGELKPLN